MSKKLLLTLFLVSLSTITYAQRVSVSTDVLKWGTLSPNMSVDLILSSRLSLNMEGVFNPLLDIDFKRTSVSTELRWWFKRPMYSHYLGFNIGGSVYSLKLNNDRYKGEMASIGLGYGYSFIISKRISLTPNIGLGCGYVHSYTNPELKELSPIRTEFKPVVTRLGISFSYIIN